MSKPRLQAPRFSTITDADWCREIQAARQRGREDGNEMLRRIRAAEVAEYISRSGKTLEPVTCARVDSGNAVRECSGGITLQMQDAQPANQKATEPADGVRK